MGVLDFISGKLKKQHDLDLPPAPDQYPQQFQSPTLFQSVQDFKQQGMSDSDIIEHLQSQGFQPSEIYDALSQSVAAQGSEPFMPPQQQPQMQHNDMQNMQMNYPEHKQNDSNVEETVEAIVAEKLHEFQSALADVSRQREKSDSRMDRLEQSFADLKSDVESLHKALVGKIGDYDRSLLDVGTEIKAMEKVFQKVLPELTSNVQELSRINKKKKSA